MNRSNRQEQRKEARQERAFDRELQRAMRGPGRPFEKRVIEILKPSEPKPKKQESSE